MAADESSKICLFAQHPLFPGFMPPGLIPSPKFSPSSPTIPFLDEAAHPSDQQAASLGECLLLPPPVYPSPAPSDTTIVDLRGAESCVPSAVLAKRSLEGGEPEKTKKKKKKKKKRKPVKKKGKKKEEVEKEEEKEEKEEKEEEEEKKQPPRLGTFTL
jgi:hypothetical protein